MARHADGCCMIPRCKRPASLVWMEEWQKPRDVCDYHWRKHCDETDPFTLRKEKTHDASSRLLGSAVGSEGREG